MQFPFELSPFYIINYKKSPVFPQATVQPICIYFIRQKRRPVSPTMPGKENYTRIHSKEL